jgi:hypothetical protein
LGVLTGVIECSQLSSFLLFPVFWQKSHRRIAFRWAARASVCIYCYPPPSAGTAVSREPIPSNAVIRFPADMGHPAAAEPCSSVSTSQSGTGLGVWERKNLRRKPQLVEVGVHLVLVSCPVYASRRYRTHFCRRMCIYIHAMLVVAEQLRHQSVRSRKNHHCRWTCHGKAR